MAARLSWGILGTANIARAVFLPALREAGDADAAVVGSRTAEVAERFAAENGVARGVQGYQAILDDASVNAVYIPLPNSLHGQWAIAALRAGKVVLCEKPLCATVQETEQVLAVARESQAPLWEAFVFPFHQQIARVQALIGEGTLGELREIQSTFHFRLTRPQNIRYSRALAGGALNDVGCYPVRIARLLFGQEPETVTGEACWGSSGVDVEMSGMLGFPGERKLLLSCGFRREYDTFTRLLGTQGQIHMTNPFHPEPLDSLEILADGKRTVEYPTKDRVSFTAALRHIHAVMRGEETPRYIADADSIGNARALQLVHASLAPEGQAVGR
jgi:predicted dehydrogenase